MTIPGPSEGDEQAALVRWFQLQHPSLLVFSIPNGAQLSGNADARARQMAHLKRTGLVPGIPDLCIPALNLWVEMKSVTGRVSPAQEAIHEHLRNIGHTVVVAYGAEDARRKLAGIIGPGRQGEFQHIGDVAKRVVQQAQKAQGKCQEDRQALVTAELVLRK